MTPSNAISREKLKDAKLPRKDWILLPLIGVLTIYLCIAVSNRIAGHIFPQSADGLYGCILQGEVADHLHGIENTVCEYNNNDEPITEYRLNRCGHRTDMECGQKPSGTYRIVMLGSSFAVGEGMPVEDTIASLLPEDIAQSSGRRVDLYNMGMYMEHPYVIARYFEDVKAQHPDMVLWVLTPHDLEAAVEPIGAASAPPRPKGFLQEARWRAQQELGNKSLLQALQSLWSKGMGKIGATPTANLLRHLLPENQSGFDGSSLTGIGDRFLRVPTDPLEQQYLQQFASDLAIVSKQARAMNIPLFVTLIPSRSQAAMLSLGRAKEGFSPYALNDELRAAVEHEGCTYIDILPEFHNLPDAEQYYFLVNGHPNPSGAKLIARFMANELVNAPLFGNRAEPASSSVITGKDR